MSAADHPVGAVCWVDLGSPDVDATAEFYRALFGWSIAAPDSAGYRLASVGDRLVAALGPAENRGPPYWTVYLHTEDITASIDAVSAAGGSMVAPPTRAGDAGTAAVVRDPFGEPLSLWQPGGHTGTYASGEHGTFGGVRYRTDSPAVAAAFFRAVADWRLSDDGTFTVGDRAAATCEPRRSGSGSPWLVEFLVLDIAETIARAVRLGAREMAPNELTDPWGASFAVRQVAA
ncbi:VOC family protein [Pseudonocardia spinosispora]|uniref:VOC family protein n=1 Tax=Pseudonocardia spinosispora TaxID=103441 RepID=UPI0004134864|nr:VOC family protein [Pseudonocardia spinosispora]